MEYRTEDAPPNADVYEKKEMRLLRGSSITLASGSITGDRLRHSAGVETKGNLL